MIHRLSTFHWYARHLDPIWAALPDDMRGDVIGHRRPKLWRVPKTDLVLIAGAVDIDYDWGCRQVYVEHGAGQAYVDARAKARPYYPGGPHPPNVVAYICPNERVAASWGRPAVAVGCPALDELPPQDASAIALRKTVAMTFHWRGETVCPEAGSALEHYIDDLPMIIRWAQDHGCDFIGHAHPRDVTTPAMWERLGVEYVDDPDEVLMRASCLIADNTSLLYEAAALGLKTKVLNAPWYRRDVHHGLRFWDAVPGPMFDDGDGLVRSSPTGHDSCEEVRAGAVATAYSVPVGGGGAQRAARSLVEWASTLGPC